MSCVTDLKNYYINILRKAEKSDDYDVVKEFCIKLYALANLNYEKFKDGSLLSKVVEDIFLLLDEFEDVTKEILEDIIEENSSKKLVDSNGKQLYKTKDGHIVKSEGEQAIDNILYEYRVVHCYEKYLLVDDEDDSVECDWFIPVLNEMKGIYIEYWGMEKNDYMANKERKLKIYKKLDLPLIEIQLDDYKDSTTLSRYLLMEINKLAKKHFGVDKHIK